MVWYNTLICLIFLLFYSREMCLRFADLERKLGEIDRARAVYMHASQMADPRVCSYLLRFSRASFPLKELETNLNKSDSPRSSPHLNCHAMRVQAKPMCLLRRGSLSRSDKSTQMKGVFHCNIPASHIAFLSFSDHSSILERMAWLWSSAWKRGYIPRNVTHQEKRAGSV